MIKILSDIKTKITAILSSILSVLGIGGGGASVVCQTTCSASSSVLPLIGISLAATPLAFLVDYQPVIWWVAFAFLVLLTWLYVKNTFKSKVDRALIVINAGLIIVGFPYFKEVFFIKNLPWVGGFIFIFGIILLVTSKKIILKFKN